MIDLVRSHRSVVLILGWKELVPKTLVVNGVVSLK
jgi:hypothetical protein